jgi:ABC-type lipoprotein release transport system permease subunit
LTVGQGFTFAIAGLALGLGMAVELTGVMQSLSAGMSLFQVSATDVSTRSAVVLRFIPIALAASCILALRATRTDPTSTLRVG